MSETKGRERGHQGASRRPNPCGGGSTLPGPMSRRTGPLSWLTVHRDQARDDLPPLGGRRAFLRGHSGAHILQGPRGVLPFESVVLVFELLQPLDVRRR